MQRFEWRDLHRRVMAELRIAWKTERKWANPLSIYGPDEMRMAVTQFNASRRESAQQTRAVLEGLKAAIANLKVQQGEEE